VKAFLEAADMIEHLSSVAEDSSAKAALCEKVMEDYDKMRRERDAAIADIARACGYCKHYDESANQCTNSLPCGVVSGVNTRWEWRGVHENA
jgi:hypothetical protein